MMGMLAAAAVSIQFAAFAPAHTDVVTGDMVTWANDSARAHDVVARDGRFDSGRMPAGAEFMESFDTPGVVAYYCSIHPSMVGEIDVHDLLLDAPVARAGSGKAYVLTGRAGAGLTGTVTVAGDDGSHVTAPIAPDGTFRASVIPRATTSYHAQLGDRTSPPVQVLVLDHAVAVHAVHHGLTTTMSVHVTPAAPGETVVLQLRLKDRFGWWPVARTRLDKRSTARFVVRRRATVPARVLLTLPDGATELARSRSFRAGPV